MHRRTNRIETCFNEQIHTHTHTHTHTSASSYRHVWAHVITCRVLYPLRRYHEAGIADGEAVERTWSFLTKFKASLLSSSPLVYHNTISNALIEVWVIESSSKFVFCLCFRPAHMVFFSTYILLLLLLLLMLM